jgi:hypothetical protein
MMDKSQDCRLRVGILRAAGIARTFIAGVRRLFLLVFCGVKGQTKYLCQATSSTRGPTLGHWRSWSPSGGHECA